MKIDLSVQQAAELQSQNAFWDGFAAGAQATAEAAKRRFLSGLIAEAQKNQPQSPPAQEVPLNGQ